MYNGKGKLTFPDGSAIYEGDFKNNHIHGKGLQTWKEGNTYDGDWTFGEMDGKGTFSWKNGNKYIGEYKNDNKEG